MELVRARDTENFAKQHPDLQALLRELDGFCASVVLAPLVVTCLDRTEEENEADGGQPNSWHLFKCAADLRIKHLTSEQQKLVAKFLIARCKRPNWELVLKDHGTGPHFHIARRDPAWIKRR